MWGWNRSNIIGFTRLGEVQPAFKTHQQQSQALIQLSIFPRSSVQEFTPASSRHHNEIFHHHHHNLKQHCAQLSSLNISWLGRCVHRLHQAIIFFCSHKIINRPPILQLSLQLVSPLNKNKQNLRQDVPAVQIFHTTSPKISDQSITTISLICKLPNTSHSTLFLCQPHCPLNSPVIYSSTSSFHAAIEKSSIYTT